MKNAATPCAKTYLNKLTPEEMTSTNGGFYEGWAYVALVLLQTVLSST